MKNKQIKRKPDKEETNFIKKFLMFTFCNVLNFIIGKIRRIRAFSEQCCSVASESYGKFLPIVIKADRFDMFRLKRKIVDKRNR
jgi:methenyltetrahydromethanopterin cyclohydrolase